MSPLTFKRSRVTLPASGENATMNSHAARSLSGRCPHTVMRTSDESGLKNSSVAKHALALPPRMASQTSLVGPLGLPSRISLMVKPLPMPCSTRSASKKLLLPLALVPMNRFIAPSRRSTFLRFLKFSMTMRSSMVMTLSQPAK